MVLGSPKDYPITSQFLHLCLLLLLGVDPNTTFWWASDGEGDENCKLSHIGLLKQNLKAKQKNPAQSEKETLWSP